MNTKSVKNTTLAAGLILAGLPFAGCGGSSGIQNASPIVAGTTGKATISILWPAPAAAASRLIPVATTSVLVNFLTSDGSTIQSQLLLNPNSVDTESRGVVATNPTTTTATFVDLPQGALTVSATAYSNPDGSGTALASARVPVTIIAGQSTPVNMTLASTIVKVDILPHGVALSSAPTAITAVAYDAKNNVVFTNQWNWADSNSDVVSLAAAGGTATLTAVGPGSGTITLTETESNKKLSETFTVNAVSQ